MGRKLEIGPGKGSYRALGAGWETFNLGKENRSDGSDSNHVGDARDLSRFGEEFEHVYSSHCIEHMHWYDLHDTIKGWARILKPGGKLEVHTVDGAKVMKCLLEWEEGKEISQHLNLGWRSNLTKSHPQLWLQGKLYNYTLDRNKDFDYHLHRSMLTPKLLTELFKEAGLVDVRVMKERENTVPDNIKKHGWINLGVIGTKA